MKTRVKRARGERGVAILITIFALVVLSAIAAAMIFLAATDTTINRNYRSAQKTYFGAKAGIERVRSRMVPSANDLAGKTPTAAFPAPTKLPGSAAGSIVYILNPAIVSGATETIDPTSSTSSYYDTELCHEFPGLYGISTGTGSISPGTSCTAAITNAGAIGTQTETLNTAAAPYGQKYLPWKWARITMKSNTAVSDPTCTTNCAGWVNGTSGNTDLTDQGNQVCWDGAHQFVAKDAGYPDCVTQTGPNPNSYEPVYLVTALALDNNMVAGTGVNPTRRMAQMEIGVIPTINPIGAVSTQSAVILNGTLGITGWDMCTCQCTPTSGGQYNGLEVCSGAPRVAGGTCDNTKVGIYSAGSITSNGGGQVTGGSAACPSGGSSCYTQNGSWPYDVPSLVNTYKQGAVNVTNQNSIDQQPNWSCTSGGWCASGSNVSSGQTSANQKFGVPPAFPPGPDPSMPTNTGTSSGSQCYTGYTGTSGACWSQTTYIPGSAKLTAGASGNGILVVDGDLEVNGGFNWYGLILVKGTLKFSGGGSQAVNIFGAVLTGQSTNYDFTAGGSVTINYDYCAIGKLGNSNEPSVLAYRELEY